MACLAGQLMSSVMGCAIQGHGQLQKLCQIERRDQNSVYTVSHGRSVDRQASSPTPLQRIGIWDCASRNGHRTDDWNDPRLECSTRTQPHDSWCGRSMTLPTALQFHIKQVQSGSCPAQAPVASRTVSDYQNRFTDWCVFWNTQPLDSGQPDASRHSPAGTVFSCESADGIGFA